VENIVQERPVDISPFARLSKKSPPTGKRFIDRAMDPDIVELV